ncbi:hypothetical protein [Paenibacillus lautus]|uniref:hypothetical protein n=1 Tax=Paenibacillus lautus TaxID=1401 RepID=UPI003D2AF0DC
MFTCYFSPEFDYYAMNSGVYDNKISFVTDVDKYIEFLSEYAINKVYKLDLKGILAKAMITKDVNDNVISKAMMEMDTIVNDISNKEIWEIFQIIYPQVIDQIDVKWVASFILPDMGLEKGRLGIYKKSKEKYELRLALGVQRGNLEMSKDILIRGIWWYVTKIILYEFIGEKYNSKENENFLVAIHICLFKMVIYLGGKGEENITIREALLGQRFYLSARLYNILESQKPEEWFRLANDWLVKMIENRLERQTQ